jgi:hypothetical protein
MLWFLRRSTVISHLERPQHVAQNRGRTTGETDAFIQKWEPIELDCQSRDSVGLVRVFAADLRDSLTGSVLISHIVRSGGIYRRLRLCRSASVRDNLVACSARG